MRKYSIIVIVIYSIFLPFFSIPVGWMIVLCSFLGVVLGVHDSFYLDDSLSE